MPLHASEQDSPGSFLLTRPDRVSGPASYKTSKVGREPQGESLARGSNGARAECGGVFRNRTKFFEAKTVVTFNARAPRQSNLGSFLLTSVLNQTFQSCTAKMILPRKVALCLGFNLPEVSENNQTKLLEKSTKCPLKSTLSTFGCNPYVAEF